VRSPRKVLVTRPAEQSHILIHELRVLGYEVQSLPTLTIERYDPEILRMPVSKAIADSDWLIFTSASAVAAIAPLLQGQRLPRIAAIGGATSKRLQSEGIKVDAVPGQDFSSEGLVALPEFNDLSQQVITLVRGEGGREWLADELARRGANVQHLIVYKRHCPPPLSPDIKVDADIVVSTSVESLNNLFQMIAPSNHLQLFDKQFIVFSERGAAQARQLGIKSTARVRAASDAGIIEAITLWEQQQED
jgi:uroporphyrinogen-III synthase